jgi:hypothetical protein
MLDHLDRDRRQLLDLPARGPANRRVLALGEHMPAVAALRVVLDHLVHCAGRQQLPAMALVTRLSALLAPRRVLAPSRRRGRRVGTWGLRAIARAAVQPALELRDPLILARDTLLEPPDLLVHPQEHRHDDLAALVVDRLRLRALHA